jgi:hypothetical protein
VSRTAIDPAAVKSGDTITYRAPVGDREWEAVVDGTTPERVILRRPRGAITWDRVLSHTPAARALAMMGYSTETRAAITRLIALSPVLEEAILAVAELAFADGAESADG